MRRRFFLTGAGASLGLGACSPAGGSEFSAAAAEAAYPPVGSFVDAAGERLHYVEQGEGPAVVLIHGASGNLRDWTFGILPRLAARHRVIAFDRPGFGYSTRQRQDASDPAVQAAVLREAAQKIGARRPIVVGHSYGGAVAMAWAVTAPQPPEGIVSISGVVMPYASALGELSRAIGVNELISLAYARYVKANFGDGIVQDFLQRVWQPQPVPEGYARHVGPALSLREKSVAANAEDLSDLDDALDRLAPRYGSVTAPVEVLHGKADRIVQPRQAQELAAALPNARLTMLPGIGHMAHHAATDTLLDALDRIASA